MTFILQRIDELIMQDHYHLNADDVCYFYGEYTARKNAAWSDTNQLIINLKKGVNQRNQNHYKYKHEAISEVAKWLGEIGGLSQVIFVPVPPSKCKTDPAYDDRLVRILTEAKKLNPETEFRELIYLRLSMTASHQTTSRPGPDDIAACYVFDAGQAVNLRSNLIIFDDVLTAGSHFRAMKQVLQSHLPGSAVFGLFIARTVRESNADMFDEM